MITNANDSTTSKPAGHTPLQRILAVGAAVSAVLCILAPTFCLFSSPSWEERLQSTLAQTALAEDLGVTVTPPAVDESISYPDTPVSCDEDAAESGEAGPESDSGASPLDCEPKTVMASSGQTDAGTETDSECPAPSDTVLDATAYLDDAVPRDEDLPTGPDMTRALETGVPMEGGPSAEPMDALLQVVEDCVAFGTGAVAILADELTGIVVYA